LNEDGELMERTMLDVNYSWAVASLTRAGLPHARSVRKVSKLRFRRSFATS